MAGLRGTKLLQRFNKYCKAAVYKHARKEIDAGMLQDRRKRGEGLDKKLSERDRRILNRTLKELRKTDGFFSIFLEKSSACCWNKPCIQPDN